MRLASPKFPLLATLLAAGFSSIAFAQGGDVLAASIQKAGAAKVAMASAPPWMVVSPTGEAKGYSVEVLNLALQGMGLPQAVGTLTSWDAMIPGLQARQFDMVAPGLTITEARCKVVVFSGPTFVMQDALYTPTGNPKKLTGVANAAQQPDFKLAVINGSSQEAYALKQGAKPDQLVRVTDIQSGVATVTGGRANALLVGQFSIPDPGQKGLDVVVDKQSPINGYGVAFRKEDIKFRDALNKQLDILRTNGSMKDLYAGKYGRPNWDVLVKAARASDVVPGCE